MSAKSKVLGNSFLYSFSSLLVSSVGFLLLPIYTLFLSPDDYGIINLINSFVQVSTFIIAFSLYSSILRFYADYKNDLNKVKRFYGTIVTFVLFSGIIFSILGFIFRDILISIFFKNLTFYPFILIALFTMVFVSLHSLHQSILQGRQQGKKLTKINLIVFGTQVCVTLFFIGVLKMGAIGVLLSILLINISYFIFMLIDLKKNNLIVFGIDLGLLREALKYSVPIMPHNLSTNLASFFSRVFLNNSESLATIGLYSIASQFASLIDTIQSSVNKAFAPWFYEMMNIKDEKSRKDILSLSKFLLLLYTILYMGIGLFSQEVIILMTTNQYHEAWKIIPILIIGFSVKSVYYFYVNILFYYKEATKKIFIATLLGSFVDILLAFLLIPIYGMYGAAMAFTLAKIIIVGIVVLMSSRYNIGYRVVDMVKTIAISFLFLFVGLIFSYIKFVDAFSWGNLVYKITVLFIYFAYLYFNNKFIIRQILLNKKTHNFVKRLIRKG